MRQIRVTLIAIAALIILYFIYTQARAIAAPNIFTIIIIILMAVLILSNVARTWTRGY